MSFDDFALLPADDPQSSPQDDLDAAIEGALAAGDDPVPVADDPPAPYGRSWKFDRTTGQFVRLGQSPAEVSGLDALAEWCVMALQSARYAHPVFSDEFGMEAPDSIIGALAEGEVVADWQAAVVDALLVHDRITSVENISLRWEPTEGVLYLDSLDVITDEDQTVTVSDVTLQVGGF